MIRSIIRWLAGKLLEWSDPDFAAAVKAYKSQRATVEQQEDEAKQAITGADSNIAEVDAQRSINQTAQAAIDEQVKDVEKNLQNLRTEKPDSLKSDDTVLRGDL